MLKHCLFLFGCLALPPVGESAALGQGVDSEEVVRAIIEGERDYSTWQTLYVESVWETEIGEELTFAHCVASLDKLGRTRYREQRGAGRWTEAAVVESWEEWVCNGEIVVQLADLKVSENVRADPKDLPISASIYELDRRIPIRDPFSLASLASDLDRALSAGTPPDIKQGSKKHIVEVTWASVKSKHVYSAIVDLSGSLPKVLEQVHRKPNGDLVSRHTFSYRAEPLSVPLPDVAVLERPRFLIDPSLITKPVLDAADVVPFKQTYRLLDLRVDAPGDFPEATFAVVLPKGTYVWDKRFKVDYIVGEDEAVDERLAELALAAQGRKKDDPSYSAATSLSSAIMQGRSSVGLGRPAGKAWIVWLVMLNVVLLLTTLVIFGVRRQRRR